jgi:hypothetical protein
MENEVSKVPLRLQRFLRMTALRNGILNARAVVIIEREGRLAMANGLLPAIDVKEWDFDDAFEALARQLGLDAFDSLRYAGFFDCGGVRCYAFLASSAGVPDASLVGLHESGCLLRDIERKTVLAALRKKRV